MSSGEKVHHFETSFSDMCSCFAMINGIKKQMMGDNGN